MASKSMAMLLALVLVFIIFNGAKSQSTSSCGTALLGLSPCLSYVTGNSSTPSPVCCSQLATVVQNSPACLCTFTNGNGNAMGIAINQTLALALPQACNLQTPPVSQCNAAANGPASPPAALPSPAPDASADSPTADPSTPDAQTPAPSTTTSAIPQGGASKTVPTSTSDGNLTKPALFLFLAALASLLANF